MIVRRSLAAGVLALSLLAVPAAAQAPADAFVTPETQVVKLKQGALKGTVKDGVAYTLGVPYAAPPVGDLRWKPPAARADLDGRARRLQGRRPLPGRRGLPDGQCGAARQRQARPEAAGDGLDPRRRLRDRDQHGAFGGDTEGTNFAKQGIVHVSLNYRLGRAGWFAHPR